MYSNVADFIAQYTFEAAATEKLIAATSNEQFAFEPHAKVRSTGRVAWHIIHSLGGLAAELNIGITQIDNDKKPTTKEEAVAMYKQASQELLAKVQESITNDMLGNEVNLYGMKLTIGGLLYLILRHEIHHRGELMIVMRWVGDTPVGVVGPTEEEMQAMMAAKA